MPPRLALEEDGATKNFKRKLSEDTPPEGESVVVLSDIDRERGSKRRKEEPMGHHVPGGVTAPEPRLAGNSNATIVGTSLYANAHGFSIQTQNITTTDARSAKALFEYLEPHVSHGAGHGSRDRRDAPVCHPDTRVAIRENVVGWIKDGEGGGEPQKILWLSGPAGAGKSAIAGSESEACEKEGLLAASFFFSSFSPSMDRRWNRGLVATLVHQMSQHRALPETFRQRLLSALEECPDIFHKQLKIQAQHLIVEPFRDTYAKEDRKGSPKVPNFAVIVDGIDEVIAPLDPDTSDQEHQRKSEDDQVEVLQVLLALAQSPYLPFRILVASRPERIICDFFSEPTVHRITIPLFLDAKYNPDHDIELFLWSKFSQIRRRFRLAEVSWPGQSAVDEIVDMSSGQFIVPATVIRWVESGLPQQQLNEVLKLRPYARQSKNPFESLDMLYHHILTRARNPESDAKLVVKWITSTSSSLGEDRSSASEIKPATFWKSFFEDEEGELVYRMAPISSLISIPSPDDTESPFTFYHKSFIDYLTSEIRCGDLYVETADMDSFVSERIAMVLKNKGPRVPLQDEQRLDRFLLHLESFSLVHSFSLTLQPTVKLEATFLKHLRAEEREALASCDLAWWATLCHKLQSSHRKLPGLLRGLV